MLPKLEVVTGTPTLMPPEKDMQVAVRTVTPATPQVATQLDAWPYTQP
jgi:hypothetical protein